MCSCGFDLCSISRGHNFCLFGPTQRVSAVKAQFNFPRLPATPRHFLQAMSDIDVYLGVPSYNVALVKKFTEHYDALVALGYTFLSWQRSAIHILDGLRRARHVDYRRKISNIAQDFQKIGDSDFANVLTNWESAARVTPPADSWPMVNVLDSIVTMDGYPQSPRNSENVLGLLDAYNVWSRISTISNTPLFEAVRFTHYCRTFFPGHKDRACIEILACDNPDFGRPISRLAHGFEAHGASDVADALRKLYE